MMIRCERTLAHGQTGVEAEQLDQVPVVLLAKGREDFDALRTNLNVILEDHAPGGVCPKEFIHRLEVTEVAADFARPRHGKAVTRPI